MKNTICLVSFNRKHLSALFLIFLLCSFVVNAQTEADTPALPADLQRQVDEAEARKKIAEARLAELKAKFPKPDFDSLKGQTEIKELKGDFIESQILAYRALSLAAEKIALDIKTRVNTICPPTVPATPCVLVARRPEDVDFVIRYRLMLKRLEILKAEYQRVPVGIAVAPANFLSARAGNAAQNTINTLDTVNNTNLPPLIDQIDLLTLGVTGAKRRDNQPSTPSGGAGIAGIASLLPTLLVDALSFFTVEETLSAKTFEIGEKELIAEVFGKINQPAGAANNFELYYPSLIPFDPTDVMTGSPLWIKLDEVLQARADAAAKVEEARQKFARADELLKIAEARLTKAEAEMAKADPAALSPGFVQNLNNYRTQVNNQRRIVSQQLVAFNSNPDIIGFKRIEALFGKVLKELDIPTDSELNPKPNSETKDENAPCCATTTVNVNGQGEKKEEPAPPQPAKNLVYYLRAEKLYQKMAQSNGNWVDFQVVKAGGNVRIKNSPFLSIFTFGNRVSFSGGTIVSYNVLGSGGQSKMSKVISTYSPYTRSNKLNDEQK